MRLKILLFDLLSYPVAYILNSQTVGFYFARDSAAHLIRASWSEAGRAYMSSAYYAYELGESAFFFCCVRGPDCVLAEYEIAAFCLTHASLIMFWGSVPLQEIIEAGHRLSSQTKVKVPLVWTMAALAPQAAYNLMQCNNNNDPTTNQGYFVDSDLYEQLAAAP